MWDDFCDVEKTFPSLFRHQISTPTLKDASWRDVANLTRFSPQMPMLILGVERADPADLD